LGSARARDRLVEADFDELPNVGKEAVLLVCVGD